MIIKNEVLDELPQKYLQDLLKQKNEDLFLHGQTNLHEFWTDRAQLLLAPLENVLVLYKGEDLIASIKFRFHFS